MAHVCIKGIAPDCRTHSYLVDLLSFLTENTGYQVCRLHDCRPPALRISTAGNNNVADDQIH